MRNLILLLFGCLSGLWAAQSTASLTYTTATLLASHAVLEPKETLHLMLRLEHKKGWHSYWINPGDSGMPVQFRFEEQEGLTFGEARFPVPERIPTGPLISYGYSDTVRFLIPLKLSPDFSGESLKIAGRFDWLVCEEICVPESTELELELQIGSPSQKIHEAEFQLAESRLPVGSVTSGFFVQKEKLWLKLPSEVEKEQNPFFFSKDEMLTLAAAPQEFRSIGEEKFLVVELMSEPGQEIEGLLKTKEHQGITLKLIPQDPVLAEKPLAAAPSMDFGLALLFAFLGGLLLNLMPCVLPVLSLKALALAQASMKEEKEVRQESLFYGLGILSSFAIFALVLVFLREQGESAGWGFQLQSPVFVAFMALLMIVIGLNLAGFFELPMLFGSAMVRAGRLQGVMEPFATGVLAAFVATPCTGPFMAGAIGWALTRPAFEVLGVFFSLGLGLASPYLVLGFFPASRRFLPRPGAWMETFRQFLAWPMFAAGLWLIWVYNQQKGADESLLLSLLILLSMFFLWLWKLALKHGRIWGRILLLLGVFTVVPGMFWISAPEVSRNSELEWVEFDLKRIEKELAQGRTVFVDATADWCITCKINEKLVLSRPETENYMREHQVVPMMADWTLQDETIRQWLASFGRQGVPLYVVYRPGQEPVVLPQVLTSSLVINALEGTTEAEE